MIAFNIFLATIYEWGYDKAIKVSKLHCTRCKSLINTYTHRKITIFDNIYSHCKIWVVEIKSEKISFSVVQYDFLTKLLQADKVGSSGNRNKSNRTQSPRQTNTTSVPTTRTENKQSRIYREVLSPTWNQQKSALIFLLYICCILYISVNNLVMWNHYFCEEIYDNLIIIVKTQALVN